MNKEAEKNTSEINQAYQDSIQSHSLQDEQIKKSSNEKISQPQSTSNIYLQIMSDKRLNEKQLQRRSNNSVRMFSNSHIQDEQSAQTNIQKQENQGQTNEQTQVRQKKQVDTFNELQQEDSSSQSSSSSKSNSSSDSESEADKDESPSNEQIIDNQKNRSQSNSSQDSNNNNINQQKSCMNQQSLYYIQNTQTDQSMSSVNQDEVLEMFNYQSSNYIPKQISCQQFYSQSCSQIPLHQAVQDQKYKVSIEYKCGQINEEGDNYEENDYLKNSMQINNETNSLLNSREMKKNLTKVSEISEKTPNEEDQHSFNQSQYHQNSKKLMTLLPNMNEGDELTLDMLIGEMQKQISIGTNESSRNNSQREIPASCEEIHFPNSHNNEMGRNPSQQRNSNNNIKQIARNDRQRQGFNDMFYFSDQIKILENIVKLENHIMTEEVKQKIKAAIRRHFIFSNLEEQHMNQVVNKMFACTCKQGEFIFEQNDEASLFFFIEQGNVNIKINKEFKKCLDEFTSFGELALLYNSPRSASAQAAQDGVQLILWAIDRVTFLNVIKHINQQDLEVNRKFLENVSFFSNFTHEQKDLLASQFTYQKFHKGETIVNIGDDANSFYIIKSGQVSIISQNQIEERQLQSGDWFGESSLYLNKSIRTRTVQAKSFDVILLALSRKATQEILGDKIQYLAFRNLMRWAFEKDKILCKLITMQREKLFSHLNIRKVMDKEEVINQARPNQICVILEGILVQKSNNTMYEKAQVVGSMCLIANQYTDNQLVFSEKESLIAEISKEQIETLLGGSYEQLVTRNRKSHENSVYFSKGSDKKLCEDDDLLGLRNMKLMDLVYIKELGRGNFGSVNLVFNNIQTQDFTTNNKRISTQQDINQNFNIRKSKYSQKNPEIQIQKKSNKFNEKQKDRLFAMKVFISNYIFQRGIEKYILREKSTLQKCNFPFIMRYYRSFYDNYHIYFMNEFINGMDFFTVMREVGLFNKQQAQFYTAFIILTLQYLNNQGIVYRDLKPENILIDHEGWPKLVDMGTAKYLYDKNQQLTRTYSLVGTPHYMAPEVIQQKGYGFAVDIYSLGVILYELLVGYLPYGEDVDDPIEVYQLILEGRLGFPNHMKNRLSDKKLISQLMAKSPEVRLGGSYGALKSHEWFEDFDWDIFFNKQATPPYIPPKNKLSSDQFIEGQIQNNSKNSFQTIMMIQSAQSGRYAKDFKITQKQREFLNNFNY
ncbi:CGMP-dependent kinase 9-1 (macronuclear) [Tetrahymena thermophila SB210]|uniref:cGMP-dependent protein kinase n=1 Tax=Tetrahymena thermophila (strain SB210) TaxID=312017 RepID=Q22RR1_TETTS|nr:CGMP-dependent kinase 9-1 [Tetrahymena thermophila SB210]EAR88061.1 CGMP-dependent kinase 9-1 [Tetrahymena thermophila SB210]|eukprot:XP_001008306.1 CGMP-dependent kinase 9-1 [Tetrahymena thermophila SB210]